MPSCFPSTSTNPRTICEKITPEFPRAPISAARVDVLGDRLAVLGGRGVERLDDRPQRQNEVRAGVAIRHRIHVQVVDASPMRLEILQGAARQMADELELHQCDRTSSVCTAITTSSKLHSARA